MGTLKLHENQELPFVCEQLSACFTKALSGPLFTICAAPSPR